jgi:hypothetical protein
MGDDTTRQATRGLPPELTEGLTGWSGHPTEEGQVPVGAQIRVESGLDTSDETLLYVALEDADRALYEDGRPFRLDAAAARMLRDLLNIATARGYL